MKMVNSGEEEGIVNLGGNATADVSHLSRRQLSYKMADRKSVV